MSQQSDFNEDEFCSKFLLTRRTDNIKDTAVISYYCAVEDVNREQEKWKKAALAWSLYKPSKFLKFLINNDLERGCLYLQRDTGYKDVEDYFVWREGVYLSPTEKLITPAYKSYEGAVVDSRGTEHPRQEGYETTLANIIFVMESLISFYQAKVLKKATTQAATIPLCITFNK
jgi:hypothetical protein